MSARPREVLVRLTACAPERELTCTECGAIGHASCDCAAPYVRVAAALADEKNRHRSNRAIAAEIGVSHTTVNKLRKGTGNQFPVEPKRIGRDGRSRRMPTQKTETPLIHEDCDDCVTVEQRWQRSCAGMLGEMLSLRPYWRKEFGEWEKFKPTSALVKLATQAAEELTELAEHINSLEVHK